jgi:hypothetical protein
MSSHSIGIFIGFYGWKHCYAAFFQASTGGDSNSIFTQVYYQNALMSSILGVVQEILDTFGPCARFYFPNSRCTGSCYLWNVEHHAFLHMVNRVQCVMAHRSLAVALSIHNAVREGEKRKASSKKFHTIHGCI